LALSGKNPIGIALAIALSCAASRASSAAPASGTMQKPLTVEGAKQLLADSMVLIQNKSFARAKVNLDDCIDWGESTKDFDYLANAYWLRAITEVDLLAPGTGSAPAESDFERAVDAASGLPHFSLARFGELEQQRGVNLENLHQIAPALAAFRQGAEAISQSPDLMNRLSPESKKQIELLYDIGAADELLGDYRDEATSFVKAATILRSQMALSPTSSVDGKEERSRFDAIIRALKTAYDKQGVDGLARVTELINHFQAVDKQGK
jgi:tetratricopeptide (TPR) repeat protein